MTMPMHIPHPGSALDRTQRGSEQEFMAGMDAGASVEPTGTMEPIPVTGTPRVASGDVFSFSTVTLNGTIPYRLVLPQDPQRYRAQVIAGTAGTVYLCATRSLAQEVGLNGSTAAGGAIPSNVVVPLMAKGEVYAATPGTVTTLLTVMVERYENADPH